MVSIDVDVEINMVNMVHFSEWGKIVENFEDLLVLDINLGM